MTTPNGARPPATLADIAADPTLAATLSAADRTLLIPDALALVAALLMAPATNTTTHTDVELLTAEEVAALFKVPESKIAEMMRRGEIRVVMLGRYPRVRRADLAALIDKLSLPRVTSHRDPARLPAAPNTARALAGAARRQNGHHQGKRVEMGSRRAADLGAGGPVSDAPGPDAG
jgi:excisionase family DNA binding protein